MRSGPPVLQSGQASGAGVGHPKQAGLLKVGESDPEAPLQIADGSILHNAGQGTADGPVVEGIWSQCVLLQFQSHRLGDIPP